jgi:hypothetical protein
LTLKKGFASNLLGHHLVYRTPEVARERKGRTNLEIGLGLLLKFKVKKNVAKRISLGAWLPFRL